MKNMFLLVLMLVFLNQGVATAQNQQQEDKNGIFAEFVTSKGKIVVRLEYTKNPMTVANFIGLAEGTITNASFPKGKPFYNGSIWHRVVKGHVIQGGSPAVDKAPEKEDGSATGYVIPNEISGLSHNKAGMLGMANAGPHTNTCQYYITLADRSYLDGNYTVFGEVTEGMDVVNSIVQGDTTLKIDILRKGAEAKRFKVNDETFRVLVDNQWKKVKEEEENRKASDEKFINEKYSGLISGVSGLRYRILKEGTGDKPVKGSALVISYTGQLVNGVTFAGSAEEGRPAGTKVPAAFSYTPGITKLIPGIENSLYEMRQGEQRLLVIPADLAYSNTGFYGKQVPGQKRFIIPPGEILIIELTLVSFK